MATEKMPLITSGIFSYGKNTKTFVISQKRVTFVPMKNQINANVTWSENIIIADGDYVDKVAFDLIVNFERMIGRRIPPADLPRWIDCIALDGGMRPQTDNQEQEAQVVLIHRKDSQRMENFTPADYEQELNGKAFKDNLGEFAITALPVEDQVSHDDFFLDVLGTVCLQKEVRRVMVIPNADEGTLYNDIRETLHRLDDDTKRITVFAMQPMTGGNFRQEILGYSLMNALGIGADEIKG